MKNTLKRRAIAATCATILSGVAGQAAAANWLMLQGTEAPNAAPTNLVWGFLQPTYSSTKDTKITTGPWQGQSTAPNQTVPDLTNSNGFNLLRARIGVRGQNFPLNSHVNYMLLAEFGNNGTTYANGGSNARLSDASVTLNYIPGARVRVGQFKTPGAEEAMEGYPYVSSYVNFTNATDQLLLERFFKGDGCDGLVGPSLATCTTNAGTAGVQAGNPTTGPVGAFRDVGVEVFDAFRTGDWEHSYALMVGNGNGIDRGDNNNNKDVYEYLSTEKVFGGAGPLRHGLKFFVWNQDGKRDILNGIAQTNGKFDRVRNGLGMTLRTAKYHVNAEYIHAKGMIFEGTDGAALPGAVASNGVVATYNVAPNGKANGYYVDFGYMVMPRWELDARYDVLNRRTDNASAKRVFKTTTIGTQYFFDARNRVTINYEFRKLAAPDLASTDPTYAPTQGAINSLDNRLSVQLTSTF